ncbi:MAG: threonylcarbamoyl-AMP synthase [Saprospiraceae bacterium]|nr:threonylcarbamoyl-AMP synthase [Saprospiraceae bacterium]MCF8251370.1 threonylcarbamoyl-AMP synthase [Saprospiraceae bacterium]MCF8280545.1 threonylcarbamoyl-AMP synthase [Bacteroidales bacterium]MCF8313237.1 threonylcarbamoyl-AMP synthase [Saprospiraceae bacterium]MCF8441684.1 threonylcarbamoyl-AMP synthase [Saprospiraceae bacterium]
MFIEIHPVSPEPRKIKQAADVLRDGGIVIYPTDTVYGLGCDIFNHQAVEKVCKIRHLDPDRAMLSLICKDLSQVSEYAWQIENEVFRMLKKNLPGPFTFILRSGNSVPKLFKNRKRTIGIRIPNNKIALALVEELGRPILSASLKIDREDDDFDEYFTDPLDFKEHFEHNTDLIIGGGMGGQIPSTLVDCSNDEIEIIRQGAGELKR